MSANATSGPLTAWQRLRAGNERFVIPGQGRRSGPIPDRPAAVVFRCSDSGLVSETVFGQSWGSLIEVSTWGHTVDTGVMATIEYAVTVGQAPLVVILGHPDCNAMHAAMRAWNEADLPNDATRATVEHALSSIVRRGTQADSLESVTSAHLVETGVAILERSPAIAGRIDSGGCAIVCATTRPGDGRLRVYATMGAVGAVDDALLECV